MQDIDTKILGSLVGMALGDAIGDLAYRFPRRAHLYAKIDDLDTLYYTGDTAMGLALAESLVEIGHINPTHIGDTIRDHYKRQTHRCFGPGLPRFLSSVEELRLGYSEAAKRMYQGQGSFGNGAAMRVPPVGLMFHNDPHLYKKAVASAEVTHTHPCGKDGAAVMAKAVAQSVQARPGTLIPAIFCQNLITFSRVPDVHGKMVRLAELLEIGEQPVKAAHQLGRSVTVHESMPFAFYSFLRNPDDFRECLATSVCNGGDCNTLGSMTGALCGAYLGLEGIPDSWIRKLENADYIQAIARRLSQYAHDLRVKVQA